MAVINCDFSSDVLSTSTSMHVILPQPSKVNMEPDILKKFNTKPAVLYLLHGYSGDHTGWTHYSSLARYVREMNIAVIMPTVSNSYYTNMENKFDYWTFFSEELPEIVHRFFNITSDPQKTFVAGLSMGGYGAFKLALTYPEKFAAAGSFSGALDIFHYYNIIKSDPDEKQRFDRIFGDMDNFNGSENDLFQLADNLKKSNKTIPKLYQCCGTEDFLYKENQNLKNHLLKNNVDLTYEEGPGEHNWDYWDPAIKRFLDFTS